MADNTPADEERIRKITSLGPLHDLLLRATPPNEDGDISITILAGRMGISTWSIYKWCKDNKIPPNRASEIVDLSDGRVSLGDFTAFVYL